MPLNLAGVLALAIAILLADGSGLDLLSQGVLGVLLSHFDSELDALVSQLLLVHLGNGLLALLAGGLLSWCLDGNQGVAGDESRYRRSSGQAVINGLGLFGQDHHAADVDDLLAVVFEQHFSFLLLRYPR